MTESDAEAAYRLRCGERLAFWRKQRMMSTYELARAAGISNPSLITRYEVDGVLPNSARQFVLADALGVSPEALWGFSETAFSMSASTFGDFVRQAARMAHYLSTYCIHEDCDNCRENCKICDAPCQCECHRR